MEFVHLIGKEEVVRAGQTMQHAAETMSSVAASIEMSVTRLVQALDSHASRMEALASKEREIPSGLYGPGAVSFTVPVRTVGDDH